MLSNEQWFETIKQSYLAPPVSFAGRRLPGFPSDQIQANTTGQAGVPTLQEAFVFYEDCIAQFRAAGADMSPEHRLLDFGTGWGRIARFFMRELPAEHIFGLDVTKEFIHICRDTFASDNFHLTTPMPPTTLSAESFQYIVGYSVFSHLSEQACQLWMAEFHRLLAPGGMVAVTTRGRPFFDFCESLKASPQHGYLGALANMYDDFDVPRARYDRGELVHCNAKGVAGGGAMTADFYGETFIPEAYARTAFAPHFELVNFLFDPARQTHPILFLKKIESGQSSTKVM
ncbi:MAG: class I SAM-dependent methyltransferase [Pseudomonadota bacterium]